MNVTPAQIQSVQRTWRHVCKERGWQADDRAFRLEKFSEILGRQVDSLTTVERIAECTKLMTGLKCLLGVSVKAGIEAGDTSINDGRVLRFQIINDLVPCLELYLEDVRGYITSIMEDKNRWWKIDRPARDITLNDLEARPVFRFSKRAGKMIEFPSQLQQMQYTLTARLNALRNAAGDSIHEMRLKAKLPCGCAKCARQNVSLAPVPAAALEIEPERVPF